MRRIIIPITAIALMAFSLPGCGEAEEAGTGAQAAGAATAKATADVMDKPMDGSSVEAFSRDLEALKAANPDGYAQVDAALRHMMFYDLSFGGSKDKLYQSLDGQTPNQILGESE